MNKEIEFFKNIGYRVREYIDYIQVDSRLEVCPYSKTYCFIPTGKMGVYSDLKELLMFLPPLEPPIDPKEIMDKSRGPLQVFPDPFYDQCLIAAMQSLIPLAIEQEWSSDDIAFKAFRIASAMLEARKERGA
jgi:hypothetical protein